MHEETLKVLVVDDDPFVAEMLVVLLEDGGYAVVSASDGEEALAMFIDNSGVDLVLTDMNMPGMDGLDLTREIRKVKNDVPVILLTARDDEAFAREARERGVHCCLVKDENLMEEITGIVDGVLGA